MKLQKLCSPLGISNDHNVTRAILNDTVSGKVILVLFRFSCKLSTLCSLKKEQNRTKYLLLQNYMASSVSMILAFSFSVRYHLQLNKCHLSPITSLWISQLAANLPSRTIWDLTQSACRIEARKKRFSEEPDHLLMKISNKRTFLFLLINSIKLRARK